MKTPTDAPLRERPAVALSLAVFCGMCLLQILRAAPFPQNDLLRDVVAYAWGFDYRKLYAWSTSLPTFDPYLEFDWLSGWVSRWTSPRVAAHLAQGTGFVAYCFVIVAGLRKTGNRLTRGAVTLLVVLGTLATGRLVDGRPEIVATVWLLSAASLRPLLWVLLGLLLTPAYWLIPVYAVGGLLLDARWRIRLVASAAAASGGAMFWLAYGGRDWVRHIAEIPGMAAHRISAVPEAAPIWQLIHHPGTWILVVLVALTVRVHSKRLREPGWLAPIVVFLAIGSVRHVLVLAPLLTLWALRQPWRAPRAHAGYGLFLLSIVSGLLAMTQLSPDGGIPRFQLPTGTSLLTGYNQGVFSLPFYNPGTLSIAPSIESAWDGDAIRSLAAAVDKGSLSCEQLRDTPFRFVLSNARFRLKGACFRLVDSRAKWSLWEVTSATPTRAP
jgi:hypothetical protein